MRDFEWACPDCRAALEATAAGDLVCPDQGTVFAGRDGVLVLMNEERLRHYALFVADYAEVRRQEGRGSPTGDYYQALPDRDLSGRHRLEWRVRAASFRALLREVVPRVQEHIGCTELTVADLGAGNCWMSHHLSAAGHRVAALDILDDPDDGLGAHRHYPTHFQPVQAEFDNLPFASASFDLVIFNGALHYSNNLVGTLAEALRVLGPRGALAVMDSPVYRDPAAGREMKSELHQAFKQRYGFASDRLETLGFLSEADLSKTARELGLRWRRVRPSYGLRWTLRPLLAKVRRRREPASFFVLWARRPEGAS